MKISLLFCAKLLNAMVYCASTASFGSFRFRAERAVSAAAVVPTDCGSCRTERIAACAAIMMQAQTSDNEVVCNSDFSLEHRGDPGGSRNCRMYCSLRALIFQRHNFPRAAPNPWAVYWQKVA